jgi:cell division protein FtsB
MARKNKKIRRRGKVIIPDLLNNLGNQAGRLGSANRRRVIKGIKLVLIALVVYAFASGPTGSVRLVKLYLERQELRAEDRRLTVEIMQLDNIRRYLETDTTYLEKVAREDYGFSHPEEIIYLEPEITVED